MKTNHLLLALLIAGVVAADLLCWDALLMQAFERRAALSAVPREETQPRYSIAGLPPGEGQEAVIANCISCHSSRLIVQNRMTRERWDKTIAWMQKTQNLRELSPDLRREILDYLAKHFAPPAEPTTDRRIMPIE